MKKSTKLIVVLSFCMFIVSVALVAVFATTNFGITANGKIRFDFDDDVDVTFSKGYFENMTAPSDSFQKFTVSKDVDDVREVEGYQSWESGGELYFTEESEGMGRLIFTVINNAPVSSEDYIFVDFQTNTKLGTSPVTVTPSADFCIGPGKSHTFDVEFKVQDINSPVDMQQYQLIIWVRLERPSESTGSIVTEDGWFIDEDYNLEIQLEFDDLRSTATVVDVQSCEKGGTLPAYVIYKNRYYTVNAIGDYAFQPVYDWLKSIYFQSTVTKIGEYAFKSIDSLTSVTFPHSIETIGDYAFDGCMSLTGNVSLPPRLKTLGAGAFQYTKFTGTLRIPRGLEVISESAFCGCTSLTSLVLPEGLTRISDSAFSECDNLAGNLILPNTVTYLGECCFYDCPKLTGQLIIPPSVIEIRGEAFRGCNGFSALILNEGLEVIGYRAFKELDNLQNYLYLPTTLREIGTEAFCLTGFYGDFIIPEGITTISGGAFSGIGGMDLLVLPKSIQLIDKSAFSGTYFDNILCYTDVAPRVEANGFSWDEETYCYVPDSSYSDFENAGWDSFTLRPLSEWW